MIKMDARQFVMDSIIQGQKTRHLYLNTETIVMNHFKIFQQINRQKSANITNRVSKKEDGLKQTKISQKSAKLFKMVNIITVKSAINGIYSIEKIKVRNGQLQVEENMIVKEKNKVNGLFWRKKQSNCHIKQDLIIMIGKSYIRMQLIKTYPLQNVINLCDLLESIIYLYDDDEFPSKYKKYVNQSFQFCKSKILGFKICQYLEGKKQGELNIVYNNMKIGGGEFNLNGCKQGFWTKFYKYITPQIYVIYQGEYNDGQKINKWSYEWIEPLTRNCKIIGGGIYDQNQLKQGEWTELSNNFKEDFQVILTGQYKNGIKQGQWNTLFRRNQKTRFKKICGGLYNEEGIKEGQWTELTSYFSEKCKIVWCGEYKGGNKNGQWFLQQKTIKFDKGQSEKQTEIIGGGEYDLNSFKIGNWTELLENQNENYQAVNEGQYHNGIKTNKWIIKYRYSDSQPFEIIGGGEYDKKGRKQGKWEDLAKNFSDSCQLIVNENYQAGIIQGQHMIKLRKISGSNLQLEDLEIGQLKLGRKEGNWIEISNNFKEYLKNIKDILKYFIKGCTIKGLRKECGKYNLGNNPIRNLLILGEAFMKMVEKYNHGLILMMNFAGLDFQIFRTRQLIYNVDYQEGKKVNFCEIKYRGLQENEFKRIGQGEYDGNGMKDKEWVQPNENFWRFNQLIDYGQYRNGVKIKQWQIIRDTNLIIEQGDYNQDGRKHGIWVEFDDKGFRNFITSWQGTYDQGKKTGEWIWQIFQKQINSWKYVGNFHYDDEEMKNGICTEIDQNYLLNKFTYIGMYSNGRKVGQFKEKLNKI